MAKTSGSKIIQFFAYIATGFIAVALLLSVIFGGWANGIASIFANIGQAIAYIVTMIIAAYYVRGKRHVAWLVCYIVFAVSIVVLYIVNLVI